VRSARRLRRRLGVGQGDPDEQSTALPSTRGVDEPQRGHAFRPPHAGQTVRPGVTRPAPLLADLVRQTRPSIVLEWKRTSTLWLAHALRHNGKDGRVVALGHERQYTEQTRMYLEDHELGDLA
jgi:hypothetical protein